MAGHASFNQSPRIYHGAHGWCIRTSKCIHRRCASAPSEAHALLEPLGLREHERLFTCGEQALQIAAAGDDSTHGQELLRSLPAPALERALVGLGMRHGHAVSLPDLIKYRGMNVAFWSNQMSERGTEVAMFDYADYGE